MSAKTNEQYAKMSPDSFENNYLLTDDILHV